MPVTGLRGGWAPPTAGGNSPIVTDFTQVREYPNPWRSDRPNNGFITFDQMPPNSTVKIFTVSGHLVRTLTSTVSGTNVLASWDVKNDSGDKVASGVYVYLITVGDTGYGGNGQKLRGKVAVIR